MLVAWYHTITKTVFTYELEKMSLESCLELFFHPQQEAVLGMSAYSDINFPHRSASLPSMHLKAARCIYLGYLCTFES